MLNTDDRVTNVPRKTMTSLNWDICGASTGSSSKFSSKRVACLKPSINEVEVTVLLALFWPQNKFECLFSRMTGKLRHSCVSAMSLWSHIRRGVGTALLFRSKFSWYMCTCLHATVFCKLRFWTKIAVASIDAQKQCTWIRFMTRSFHQLAWKLERSSNFLHTGVYEWTYNISYPKSKHLKACWPLWCLLKDELPQLLASTAPIPACMACFFSKKVFITKRRARTFTQTVRCSYSGSREVQNRSTKENGLKCQTQMTSSEGRNICNATCYHSAQRSDGYN